MDHPRILITDDDRMARVLLERLLTREGFLVTDCASGQEALDSLAQEAPALIVSDYDMPGLTGPELCRAIRKMDDAETASLPIILLTAHVDTEHEVASLEAGANDFVTKPVNMLILKARISTHLRLHSLRRQLEQQNTELEAWHRTRELDLEAAQVTQQAILPNRIPQVEGWQVAAHFRPLIQVGGDMYDWMRLQNGDWLFWIADATGHGASAALLTSLTKLVFRHAGSEFHTPGEILQAVNAEFFQTLRGKQFMTAACVVVQPGTGRMVFSGLGHPPLLIVRSQGEPQLLASQGPPVGILANQQCSEEVLELQPGELALLYTDGLYSDDRVGRDHLVPDDLVRLLPRPIGGVEAFVQQTVEATLARSNAEGLTDDLALVALRRTAR